jgi:hypothetical protein
MQRRNADNSRLTLGLLAVYAVWAVMLFDLNFFVAVYGVPAIGRVVNLAFVPLLALVVFHGITTPTRAWMWYPQLLLLLVAGLATIPILTNWFLGWVGIQILLSHYAIGVATVFFVRNARDALPIFALLALRFAWFGGWARASGRVPWDPFTSNTNDFGALMVQGAALCFWFGMAARVRWQRLTLWAIAAYCVVGVVTSLARGAFLALVVIAGVAWLRSPRKALTGGSIVLGAAVVFFAAGLVENTDEQRVHHRSGSFWEQVMSTFEEGTEEGTGGARWDLWTAAAKVWVTHPVVGVGPNNFGVFAAEYFRPGEIRGFDNTGRFWGMNAHSAYMQVLAEFGIVGFIALMLLFVDFIRRNRDLRGREAIERWNASTGARFFDLRALSIGLESGFIALALVNAIYASFLQPWFIAVWATNRMLWGITMRDRSAIPVRMSPRLARSNARVGA